MSLYQMVMEKLKTVKYLKGLQALREQRGAVFALSALLLPLLFGFMGLGYDVGNLYVHKAKLQDTADATALAGARGYVNVIKGNTTGVVSLPTESTDTKTKKENAIIALKENANNYIANNNPVFQDKLNHDNRTEKFYSIGKEVTSPDGNKSTEYFRVVLSEPVQLYFLPVIGIKDSANVNVYATTKLSDNEIVEVAGGESNSNDKPYKPVVIAGSFFHDEQNLSIPSLNDDPSNTHDEERDYYNASEVYIKKGGTYQAFTDAEGNPIVYANEEGLTTPKIVETDYDMNEFGIKMREEFIKKWIDELPTDQQSSKRTALTNFITDLRNWQPLKDEWDAHYKQGTQQFMIDSGIEKARAIFTQLEHYRSIYLAKLNESNWNFDLAYTTTLNEWNNEEHKELTDEMFIQLLNNKKYNASYYWLNEPTADNWRYDWGGGTWQEYSNYGVTPSTTQTLQQYMDNYMASYSLAPKPLASNYGLEYYMTYRAYNDQISSYNTSVISADVSLSGPKHSYCYLSHATFKPNQGATNVKDEINVVVDGFYTDPEDANPRTITNYTPFYLFIEDDVKLINIEIINTNRPLILCYMGSYEVHYEMTSGDSTTNRNTIRGIYYNPNAAGDTHQNGNHIDFKGSIIADKLTIHGSNDTFKYDVDEVNNWNLPFTQNVGFDNDSSGSGGDNNEVETEKITIPDHLRLVLADTVTDESHYNKVKVTWTPIE